MDTLRCTEQTHKFDDTVGPYPCMSQATHMCWTISGQWEPHCERHADGYVQNDRAMTLTPLLPRPTSRPFRDLVRDREQRDPGSAARVQREYDRQARALRGCLRCQQDRHVCPGCGSPADHDGRVMGVHDPTCVTFETRT